MLVNLDVLKPAGYYKITDIPVIFAYF